MIVSITFSFVNYCDIVYQIQLSTYRVITSNTGQKYKQNKWPEVFHSNHTMNIYHDQK